MNVGSQPTFPGNEPTQSSSSTQHSADVDPNQLLLLVPDLDKRARELAKLSKTVKETSEQVKGDAQLKALEDFAKSLIAEPDLPAGSKEALDKWISEIAKQEQTDQTTAEAQTGAQTGKPQQQAQAKADTAAPTPGEDPNLLLMDDPKASPQVKTLGKLAQTIAASQGGKLTEEQVTLLSKEAGDVFSASSSKLTDADKQLLLAFIGQLEEFPSPEGDKKTADAPNRSATTTSSQDKGSTTTKTKSQDLPNLVMDELGLGEDVHQLGQQALSYVQGNNGKLTEKESDQLKEAAEALIAGGADGDDLKALQNFLKTLLTFPKIASGSESPLLLTEQGIDPKMITLAQYANAMVKGQGGNLTQAEMTMLKSMAEELMSQLSPEDQAVLKSWLTTLGQVPVTKPPPIQLFNPADLFAPQPSKENPFMKPGIMAMLAPILSEILTINNDIIRQSSKLKQSMMKLLVAMANEAFKFAIAAGQARADQLMQEASMHLALGISGAIQAGMSIASFGVQKGIEKKSIEPKIKQMNTEKKIGEWSQEKDLATGKPYAGRQEALKQAQEDGQGYEHGSPEFAKIVADKYNNGKFPDNHENPALRGQPFKTENGKENPVSENRFTASGGFGEKLGDIQAKQQMLNEKGFNFLPTFLSQVGGSANEFIQYAFKTAQVQDVLSAAANDAYKDMINQLMQLVTQTIQSSSEEMQSAQKNWESFAQLYRDFANTITQSIYRSG